MNFASLAEAVDLYRACGFRPMPMFGVRDGACACGSSTCRAGKHTRDEIEAAWKAGGEFYSADFAEGDNVALALGPWGGSDDWLVCLDIDGPLDVEAHVGPLPPTLEQASPRGRHLFFTVPPYAPLGNWVDVFETKYRTPGALDIRYARGRVNVAPSVTLFGGYDWTRFATPAPLPEGVIDTVLARRRARGLPVARRWDRGDKRPC